MKCFKMTSHPQKNTLLQAAHCHAEAKACKRVFFSAIQEKLFFKISSPSENKKYATAQTNSTHTKTMKHNNDNGLQRRTDRRPTANMGLASCGVTCLNSSAVFQINFCAGLTVLCPEIPHERQAQKR